MAQSKPSITGTAHTLPFDRLSPRDFERLCLWLVQREGYARAEHLGAAGSEQGRDIVAWREGQQWAFQCKRVQRFGPGDAEAEVDKILGLPGDLRPSALVFLVACDISDETRRRARARCSEEMGCEFWGLTELDGRVKRHPEIVEEFFAPAGDEGAEPGWWRRFRRRPAVFYPTLAFSIVAAIVLLVAGLVRIGADLGGARGQLQEWGLVRAFPREGRHETLIVIASFHHSAGVPDTEAHWEICRAIREAKVDLGYSNLRAEVEPTRLRAEDRDGAEKLGRRYDASMVIWGADTGVRVTVGYLNLKDPEFAAAEVEISETQATYVVNPSAYAEFVTYNLPGQITFLSLFAIGHSHFVEGAYAESIVAIERAIDSLPSETEAPEGLANAYFRLGWLHQETMGDDEEAVADYDRAIELNPEDDVVFVNRGAAHATLGDYSRAIADCDQAIELNPESALAFNNRGVVYARLGEYARAIADYDRAIELDPEYDAAFNNRGLAYSDSGEYARAIADYDRTIELNPEFALAFYNRGLAYETLGDYARAIADYDRTIELNPEFALAFNGRGVVYARLGEYARAFADFGQAIELNPEDDTAFFNRGCAYYDSGHYAQAVGDYDRATELNSELAPAFFNRGLAYARLGEYARAIADFDRVIELNPEDALAFYDRGLAYARLGEYARAIADFDRAIEIDGYYADAYAARAEGHMQLGNGKAALANLRRYIELQPDSEHREIVEGWIAELEAEVSEQ